MNPLVVLGLLLMVVPLQMLINHMMKNTETGASVHQMAMNSIGAAESFYNDLQLTLKYFSKVEHLKELVLIPYRPSKKRRKMKKRQDTVIETTIFTDRTTGIATVMVTKKNRGGKNGDKRERRLEERMLLQSSGTRHSSYLRSGIVSPPNREEDTSPAKEVEEYNRLHVYYGNSKKPRTPRPPDVKFGVGEVVSHKTEEYIGVVVGWDAKCMASDQWLKKHGYFTMEKMALLSSPHYLLLVETSSRTAKPELYYIPQDHLQLASGEKVQLTKDLLKYFHEYSRDQQRYIPQQWLRDIYPED